MNVDPATPCSFPDILIGEIAEAIGAATDGRKRRLAHYLREMPAGLEFYRTGESVSPRCRIRDRLRRIEADCRKLVEQGSDTPSARLRNLIDRAEPDVLELLEWQYALRLNRKHPEAAITDGSARKALDGAFSDLSRLRACAWAASVRASQAVREGMGGDRHGADVPFDQIALQLAVLYYEVTGEKPGISTDGHSGQPSDKFVAFLGLCLEELGCPLRPQAIRSRFRRLRERYPDEWIIRNPKNVA